MLLHQTGGERMSNMLLIGLAFCIGTLGGCSGGVDPALSSETKAVGDTGGEGSFPPVNDTVFTLVADGTGGVYMGGQFSRVGQLSRQTLAHILADGTVDPSWAPSADGPVTALALENQIVYLGGSFFSVNGVERWRLAAVDRTTGDLTPWNPKLGSANLVNTLIASGGLVYVGGVFDLVNATVEPGTGLRGEARRNLAAVDAMTGLAAPWNPNVFEGEVKALTISGSVAYVGGSFERVGLVGQEAIRLDLAAFDAANGAATPWNPSVTGASGDAVFTLQLSDGSIYVGGRFDQIGGQPRQNLAAVDRITGSAMSWNLPANDTVLTLFDDGRRLYVGGLFTTVGGQSRGRLAAIDKTTGLLTPWNPQANGTVRTIAVSGGKVFVAGEFTAINGQARSKLAVLDPETGRLVDE